MTKNTTVNLRVNAEIKKEAAEILNGIGLTLSDAFNLLLYQVRVYDGLPFEVRRKPNALVFAERVESGEEELNGPFSTKEELWEALGI